MAERRVLVTVAVAWFAAACFAVAPARAEVLGYWPFNDPNTPDVAADLSGRGNDGTIVGDLIGDVEYSANGEGFTGNPGDYALVFTTQQGAGGRTVPGSQVQIDSALDGAFDTIEANNQITVGMWWFGSDVQPINQVHFWGEPDPDALPEGAGATRSFQAHIPWSNGAVFFDTSGCCGGGTQRINLGIAENLWKGSWNHWVFVKDGDYKAFYANGRKMHEGINTNPLPAPRMGIFLGYHGAFGDGQVVDGLMDDVIIFDEGLSDTADDSSRVPVGAMAEEGSGVWQLFNFGATSFVTPGINLSTELATVDEPQGQLLIDQACNADQAVTYSIGSTDTNILSASGTATFSAGGVPGQFVGFNVGAAGTATLSTTNDAGCEDYELTVNVRAITSADLQIITAGMEVGDTQPSLVTGDYGPAGRRNITSSATGTVYTSSDPNVVTVGPNGLITAVGVGTAEVTAANDGAQDVAAISVSEQLTAIAFVIGKPNANEGDLGMLDLLTSLTFSGDPGQLDPSGLPPKVIPFDDDDVDPELIGASFDLVIISSTVDASKIGGSFRCLNIPMVYWEEGLNRVENESLAAEGGTSARAGAQDEVNEFTDLFILEPGHPILEGVTPDADGFVTVFDSPQDISWAGSGPQARVTTGRLADNAQSLAEYEFLEEATLVVAEAGTLRIGNVSIFLGRRVFVWLSDESADNLTDAGRTIVSNSVNWALGGQRVPLQIGRLEVSSVSQIDVGEETQIVVNGAFRDCLEDVSADPATTYTSSNPSVASVSATGLVRGLSVGTVTIDIDHAGLLASVEITVASLPRMTGMNFDTNGPRATGEILTFFDLLGPLDAFPGAPGWEVNPNAQNPVNGSNALHITSDGINDTIEQFSRLAIVKPEAFEAEDVEFSADITWDDASGDANDRAGIYARFIDVNNWYYLLVDARDDAATPADGVELYRRKNGADALLATGSSSSDVSEGDTATLTLRIQGNELWAFVNGEPIAGLDPFVDGDPVVGVGRVGVGQRTNPAYYDNLVFQSLDLVEIDFDTTGPTATGEIETFFDLFGFDPTTANWTVEANTVNPDNGSRALRTATDGGQLVDPFSRVAILKSSVVHAANVSVEVDVTWNDNDFSGVYVRFSDDQQNFYYVLIEGNDDPAAGPMRLFRRKNGVDSTLASAASPVGIVQGSTHRIGVTVTGNAASIFVTVDGLPVSGLDPFIDDDPVVGSGRVGVGQQTNPSFYDNFSIQPLVAAEETGPPPALVHVMGGLGSVTDTFISSRGGDVPFDQFGLTTDLALTDLTAVVAAYTGAGTAPALAGADLGADGENTVTLDRAIEPGNWLKLDVTASNGGASATFSVWLAHQPLDVNQDEMTNIRDATAFGDEFRGAGTLALIDVNGDGIVNIRDATAFGNNWNGAPPLQAWRNTSLPPKP